MVASKMLECRLQKLMNDLQWPHQPFMYPITKLRHEKTHLQQSLYSPFPLITCFALPVYQAEIWGFERFD